jgi:hypothetical protein
LLQAHDPVEMLAGELLGAAGHARWVLHLLNIIFYLQLGAIYEELTMENTGWRVVKGGEGGSCGDIGRMGEI